MERLNNMDQFKFLQIKIVQMASSDSINKAQMICCRLVNKEEVIWCGV